MEYYLPLSTIPDKCGIEGQSIFNKALYFSFIPEISDSTKKSMLNERVKAQLLITKDYSNRLPNQKHAKRNSKLKLKKSILEKCKIQNISCVWLFLLLLALHPDSRKIVIKRKCKAVVIKLIIK